MEYLRGTCSASQIASGLVTTTFPACLGLQVTFFVGKNQTTLVHG